MFERRRNRTMLVPQGAPEAPSAEELPRPEETPPRAASASAGAGSTSPSSRQGLRGPRVRRRRPRWQRLLMVCALATLTGAGLGVGFFAGYVRTLPPIEQLEDPDSADRTIVVDRSGSVDVGEFKDRNQQLVTLDDIPQNLQNAFLAVEDSRFYDHYGVDLIGIARAVKEFFETGKFRQGASTFTQQLAKKLMGRRLGRNRMNVKLKIEEIFVALQIEKRYSKRQILEFYLNSLDFNYRSYGVKAGASTYFSKTLDQLTVAECAILAGMINGQSMYNPITNPKLMTRRRNLVLDRMYKLDMIDKETHAAAREEPIVTRRNQGSVSRYPTFMSALQRDLKFNYEISEEEIKNAGLTITATLDAPIQDACDRAMREGLVRVEREWHLGKGKRQTAENKTWNGVLRPGLTKLMRIDRIDDSGTPTLRVSLSGYRGTVRLPKNLGDRFYDPDKIVKEGELIDITVEEVNSNKGTFNGKLYDTKPVQGSIVVLDAHTGDVLGLSSGGNERYGWNSATQGGRQVGSVFKPFIYAAAMERGFTPSSVIIDEPIEYDPSYRPRNYEKMFFGPTTLTEALRDSRNIVTLRLFERLGVTKALDFVRKFDFTMDSPRWKIDPVITSCLGTGDFSPFEMAAAYQVFANGGIGARPQFFSSAIDKSGRAGIAERRKEQQIMDPVAAYQTMYLMRQVVTQGTGKTPIGDKFPTPQFPPICGKTGTTTNCVDASFAGFTPDLVIFVQVGFDKPSSLGVGMTGGKLAGPIWADAFGEIYKSRSNWKMSFDGPPGGVDRVTICGITGKRASDSCSAWDHRIFSNAPFRKGTAPTETCNGDPLVPIIAPVGSEYGYLAADSSYTGIAHRPYVIDVESISGQGEEF